MIQGTSIKSTTLAVAAVRSSRLSSAGHQRASMHLGRATSDGTKELLQRGDGPARAAARLRVGKRGSNGAESSPALHMSRRGVGSPYLWAKDVPRIEASKYAISSFQSNFLQASINPYIEASTKKDAEKQAYVESLVLQELVDDLDIPRDGLVVSALLTDDIARPAGGDAADRLSKLVIKKGVNLAAQEFDVETLDHVVCRIPEELLFGGNNDKLSDALQRASDVLETLRSENKLQSYGFALSSVSECAQPLDALVESVFAGLADKYDHFASLQLPVSLSSALLPFSSVMTQFRDEKQMLLFAEKPFEASLSNGKPLSLKSYSNHTGEDIALLLKSAFNLAISVERKYMESILPEHANLNLPAAENVAWAHILANQHGQFDNLEEWVYIRETQITPRFEVTLQEFANFEETKDLGFAYSIALRELLKCFTASIELLDASRAQDILEVVMSHQLAPSDRLEEVAVKAALSSGADVVLVQEQLGDKSALPFDETYAPEQLAQLLSVTKPLFQVSS